MISRSACESALGNPNVRAFLDVVAQGETSQLPDSYRTVNGGGRFNDFADHPYKGQKSPPGRASGRYQFLASTWEGISHALELHDFSPASQDLGAVGLILGRGALGPLLDGDFDTAVAKCRKEWTSLPGASENNPRWTLDKAREFYVSRGGYTGRSAPVQKSSEIAQINPERKPMAPLILALAPMLAELIPQVAKLFSSGSEVSTRNVAAIEAVSKSVVAATNSANVQEAIEKMQADPAVQQAAQQAVVTDPVIIGLLEVGGGIEKAREAGLKMQNAEKPFWFNPTFWITMSLVPMMYMIVASVLGTTSSADPTAPYWARVGFDPQTRSGLINLIVGFIFGGVVGMWFGTSYGSQKKDERAAAQG